MIALWMLYAMALALLTGAAATCGDRVLRLARRPARGVWAVALATSVVAPAALWMRSRMLPAASIGPDVQRTRVSATALDALLARATVQTDVGVAQVARWDALDRPLLIVWVVASVLAFAWLVAAHVRLRRAARAWTSEEVDGEAVLVAPDVGPAALADDGGRIVLPTWALGLGQHRRALMLAHERAHLAAHDPQLLTAATIAVALMPWNVALWWQHRRLRLAVEIDCDARVLRRHPDVTTYGALLLDVAQRGVSHRHRLATAFSTPTPVTSLERRIRSMTARRPRHLLVRASTLVAVGAALAFAACEAPRPTGLRPSSQVELSKIRSSEIPSNQPLTDETLRAAIAEHVPAVAKGTGPQTVWFIADASGKIVKASFGPSAPPNPPSMGVELRAALRDTLAVAVAAGERLRVRTPDSFTPPFMATLDANAIETVDVVKTGPGRLAPDSVNVVWVRLKPEGTWKAATNTVGQARQRNKVVDAVALQPTLRTDSQPVQLRMNAKADAGPIFIVDGKVLPPNADGTSPVDKISPDSIATVNVLKGQQATILYGDQGRNGVVLITTKGSATATVKQY